MTLTLQRSDRAETPRDGRRRSLPQVERVERRDLMTGIFQLNGAVLTGTVSLDGGAGQAGAIVQLYTPGSTLPAAVQVTDAYGNYTFRDIAPGHYLLKEVAPAGYTNNGATTLSPINPATATAVDTIDVVVSDPTKFTLTNNGAVAASSANVQVAVNPFRSTTVNSGQYTVNLGTSSGSSSAAANVPAFVIGANQNLSAGGGDSLGVQAKPLSNLVVGLNFVSPDHTGRIAYLANKYGAGSLNQVQGAALQLAMWELTYDPSDKADFASGKLAVTGPGPNTTPDQFSQIVAQATAYYNESAGKRATAVYLDPTANFLSFNTPRGVIVPTSLNFLNKTAPGVSPIDNVNLAVTDVHYAVNGVDVGATLAGNVKAGDAVDVYFTVPQGQIGRFTLAGYSSNALFDLGSQQLQTSQTRIYGQGVHSLSIKVPNTNAQIYFIHGNPLGRFDLSKNLDYFDTNQYIDSAIAFAPSDAPGAQA